MPHATPPNNPAPRSVENETDPIRPPHPVVAAVPTRRKKTHTVYTHPNAPMPAHDPRIYRENNWIRPSCRVRYTNAWPRTLGTTARRTIINILFMSKRIKPRPKSGLPNKPTHEGAQMYMSLMPLGRFWLQTTDVGRRGEREGVLPVLCQSAPPVPSAPATNAAPTDITVLAMTPESPVHPVDEILQQAPGVLPIPVESCSLFSRDNFGTSGVG